MARAQYLQDMAGAPLYQLKRQCSLDVWPSSSGRCYCTLSVCTSNLMSRSRQPGLLAELFPCSGNSLGIVLKCGHDQIVCPLTDGCFQRQNLFVHNPITAPLSDLLWSYLLQEKAVASYTRSAYNQAHHSPKAWAAERTAEALGNSNVPATVQFKFVHAFATPSCTAASMQNCILLTHLSRQLE